MPIWPRYPTIYEINTCAWLLELSEKTGRYVDLQCVPSLVWDRIAASGFDAVWLMGVWQRSPASIAIANRNDSLLDEFKRSLADFQPQDNIGSAYSVRRYDVDQRLGGPEGLALARRELAKRGIRLNLDFVPNHVALDHVWVTEHPEYFIQGNPQDAKDEAQSFVGLNGKVFACDRDPYLPAWQDVLQLNAFHAGLRQAALQTVLSIAGGCDGVRCDMAMLLLNSIFEHTWGQPRRPQTHDRVLGRLDRRRQGKIPGVSLYRQGILGSRVGTAATRIRLLLRQAALRSPQVRQRCGSKSLSARGY
jgi:hypothetical protein